MYFKCFSAFAPPHYKQNSCLLKEKWLLNYGKIFIIFLSLLPKLKANHYQTEKGNKSMFPKIMQ